MHGQVGDLCLGHLAGHTGAGKATTHAIEPTFKGSECSYRFFVLKASHTRSDQGPALAAQQVIGLDPIDLLTLLITSP